MFSGHPSEPMVDQRRFSDPRPGNDCNDVDILVCPCTIQESDILLSTKNVGSGNGQSGYGNLFWSQSCWRFADYSSRSGRRRLLEALTSDSAPCIDSGCYRWYRFEELSRVLKATPWVFLKEFLKENYDRLWNIFQLLKR